MAAVIIVIPYMHASVCVQAFAYCSLALLIMHIDRGHGRPIDIQACITSEITFRFETYQAVGVSEDVPLFSYQFWLPMIGLIQNQKEVLHMHALQGGHILTLQWSPCEHYHAHVKKLNYIYIHYSLRERLHTQSSHAF